MSEPKDDARIPRVCPDKGGVDRRDFLKLGTAATLGFFAGALPAGAQKALPPLPENPRTRDAMPTRNLGKTGYRTAIFSLGGQAAIEKPENYDVAVPIIERALDLGVNYIDTAAAYGRPDRWSQRYIGQVLKRRRHETFLATKTHDRTRDGSWKLLEDSLNLLQTDHLDLWQIHNLSRMEQVEQIFAPDGALKALVEAREQKIVRYLGVTGHADPDVLIEAIRRFPFDCILLALNAADKYHKSFIAELLPLVVEKQMGIIGMKVPARGRILGERGITMRQAYDYVLSLPVSTVIIGVDSIPQLEENVELARTFTPLNDKQMTELVARVEPIHRDALFFRRWT
ncbi:MAG TPA: aldo/keto reductase [Candidatus Xenobia bacterium]|nr:aldo/keto reductase [Candidatus Xenobia bacterium]